MVQSASCRLRLSCFSCPSQREEVPIKHQFSRRLNCRRLKTENTRIFCFFGELKSFSWQLIVLGWYTVLLYISTSTQWQEKASRPFTALFIWTRKLFYMMQAVTKKHRIARVSMKEAMGVRQTASIRQMGLKHDGRDKLHLKSVQPLRRVTAAPAVISCLSLHNRRWFTWRSAGKDVSFPHKMILLLDTPLNSALIYALKGEKMERLTALQLEGMCHEKC